MLNVVLDANIFLKLLTNESNSNKAEALFEIITDKKITIIEPSLLEPEVFSVIRRKVYFKELPKSKALKSLRYFLQLPFKTYQNNADLLNLSYSLSEELKHPVIYDTIYLATSILNSTTFVTEDKKFLKVVQKKFKDCYSLSEALDIL